MDRKRPTQEIKAERGCVGGVIQAIFQVVVNPWALVAGMVILGIAIVVAPNFDPIMRIVNPTPKPTLEPAGEEETLIIVATFSNRSEGELSGIDPAQRISDSIDEEIQLRDIPRLRVGRLFEIVGDVDQARAIGTSFNASFVIWGWYDKLGVIPHIEVLERERVLVPTPTPEGQVTISIVTRSAEERKTPIATVAPSSVEVFRQEPQRVETTETREISLSSIGLELQTELPIQATYLTFLTLGLEAYADMRDDVAIELFTTAIQSLPDAAAFFYRAQTYTQLGNYSRAINDYTQVIEQNPNFVASAYAGRGGAYLRVEDYSHAIEDFTWFINNSTPEIAYGVYDKRGQAYFSLGDYENAIQDFTVHIEQNLNPEGYEKKRRGISIDISLIRSYFYRGRAYYALDKCREAVEDFTTAMEKSLFYGPFDLLYQRGLAYSCLGNYDAALADFSHEIEMNDKHYLAYDARGVLYEKMGLNDQAIADFDKALRINLEQSSAYNNRGYVYSKKGEYDQAIADFASAIKYDPTNVLAHNNIGNAYLSIGDPSQAVFYLTRALEIEKGWSSYFLRGIAYFYLGDYDKAALDFNNAIQLNPEYAGAYHNLGNVYFSQSRYEEAIVYYTEAITREPNFVTAYLYRGYAYKQLGESAKAVADLEKFLTLSSEDDPDRGQAEQELRELKGQ
jgi:tetratricopeptide (TPR) repeat protein